MKRCLGKDILIGGVICWLVWTGAQAVDSPAAGTREPTILATTKPGCLGTGLIAMHWIPRYFLNSAVDSVTFQLDSWEAECGSLAAIKHTRLLMDIWQGYFSEAKVDRAIFYDLLAWPPADRGLEELHAAEKNLSRARYAHDLHFKQRGYDAYLRWLAAQMLPATPPGSSARLICLHLAGDADLIAMLGAGEFKESRLNHIYAEEVKQARRRLQTAWAVYAGGASNWRRDGDRSAQPVLGVRYGVQVQRTWLRVALELGGRSMQEPALAGNLAQLTAPVDSVSVWQRTDSEFALELGHVFIAGWRHSVEGGLGVSQGYRHYHPITDPDAVTARHDGIRIRNGQTYILLGYGYHLGRLGGTKLQLEVKYSWGRFEEQHDPRWFGADWSVRLVFARHRIRLQGG